MQVEEHRCGERVEDARENEEEAEKHDEYNKRQLVSLRPQVVHI